MGYELTSVVSLPLSSSRPMSRSRSLSRATAAEENHPRSRTSRSPLSSLVSYRTSSPPTSRSVHRRLAAPHRPRYYRPSRSEQDRPAPNPYHEVRRWFLLRMILGSSPIRTL